MSPIVLRVLVSFWTLASVVNSGYGDSINGSIYSNNMEPHPFTNINQSHSANKWTSYLTLIKEAWEKADRRTELHKKCGEMFSSVLDADLSVWRERGGIKRKEFLQAQKLGVHYQVINHTLYRQSFCMFGPRCTGVEHFILNIINDLPNMELIVNVFDYPKAYKHHPPLPVLSFSKTSQYWDIMYPAWTFWSGGPAVSVEPRGLGRWDLRRITVSEAGQQWPWTTKKPIAFFRGSRTSSERDPLILLSRSNPHLVDAAYTKNQAWKSLKDTLNAEPAEEVRLEDHCQYKFLVNFRGVAASFRFKHLFLCGSLVLHVGDEWREFFYPALLSWVHYVPLPSDSDKMEEVIQFVRENDDVSKSIADRGFQFIWNHLTQEDVQCYWKRLLTEYSMLMKWNVLREPEFVQIRIT